VGNYRGPGGGELPWSLTEGVVIAFLNTAVLSLLSEDLNRDGNRGIAENHSSLRRHRLEERISPNGEEPSAPFGSRSPLMNDEYVDRPGFPVIVSVESSFN